MLVCSIVFQPAYLTAHWPTVTVLLLGNTSNITLNSQTVSPSNATGNHKTKSVLRIKISFKK